MKRLILMRHCDTERWTASSENAMRVAQKLHELGLGSIRAGTSIIERAKDTAKIVAPILGLEGEIQEYVELAPQGECLPDDQAQDLIDLAREGVAEDTFIWFTHRPIARFFPREFGCQVLGVDWGIQDLDCAEAIVIDCEAKTYRIVDWSIPVA